MFSGRHTRLWLDRACDLATLRHAPDTPQEHSTRALVRFLLLHRRALREVTHDGRGTVAGRGCERSGALVLLPGSLIRHGNLRGAVRSEPTPRRHRRTPAQLASRVVRCERWTVSEELNFRHKVPGRWASAWCAHHNTSREAPVNLRQRRFRCPPRLGVWSTRVARFGHGTQRRCCVRGSRAPSRPPPSSAHQRRGHDRCRLRAQDVRAERDQDRSPRPRNRDFLSTEAALGADSDGQVSRRW